MRDNSTPFIKPFTIKISEKIQEDLLNIARSKRISLRTMFLRAVHNELDSKNPFAFDLSWPLEAYEGTKHQIAAGKLYNYIKKYPGLSLEDLFFLREDMNFLQDKEHFLICFKELLSTELIQKDRRTNNDFREYQGYSIAGYIRGIL